MNRRFALKSLAAIGAIPLIAACGPMAGNSKDIVDIAVSKDEFSTLVGAIQAAGLVGTLKSDGPFTVFAPTNSAFSKLPAGTGNGLLSPANRDQLVSILRYHVVPGAITSSQLAGKRRSVKTLQGSSVRIDGTNGVRVDGANVLVADVVASNGIIHVIDTVLLP